MTQPSVDCVIVGGGISGLFIHDALSTAGLSTVTLEAGPLLRRKLPLTQKRFDQLAAPLLAVDASAWRYQAVGLESEWLRVRAGGGRSMLWGGWCDAPTEQNLKDAQALGAPWPVTFAELAPHVRRVLRRLNARRGRVEPQFRTIQKQLGLKVVPKTAALAAGAQRAQVALDWGSTRTVRSDAVVTRVLRHPQGHVHGIEYIDAKTRQTDVIEAKTVVLCASTIETTRLLLASSINDNGLVGQGLVDHLVASYLVVLPQPAPVRSTAGPLERAALVPRFVNRGRAEKRDYVSGFCTEARGPLALDLFSDQVLSTIEVDRQSARDLSCYLVHVMGEAAPNRKRFVALGHDDLDSFGRPIPVVHLSWSANERHMARDMNETGLMIADALATPGSRIIQMRDPLKPGVIVHESGTCRMGRSAKSAVTDPHGALWEVPGLFVGDAAAMNTVLDCHPTVALLSLSSRVAARIIQARRHGSF